MERWLQIQEFPDYSVSNLGRIRKDSTDRIMALAPNNAGVLTAYLVRNGRQYARGVARLVAQHFLPRDVNVLFSTPMHLDGDRTNNAVDNLMWRPRWYALKYVRQFEEFRPPYVDRPLIEMETGLVFANSWEATKHFGLLEGEIARSYHAYHGRGEILRAWPSYYRFQRYDG